MDFLRDHVIGLARAVHRRHRHHHLFHRVGIAAGDGLQGKHQMAAHHHRVNRVLRFGGMAPFARQVNIELIGRGEKWAGADRECARRHPRPIVHPVDLLDAEALHHPVINHFAAATAALFGGLEDDGNCAIKIARLSQIFCGTKQHGRVPVMAAGMHCTGCFRGIIKPRFLMDRQGIHICAQPDAAARCSGFAFDDAHNPCAP